MHSKSCWRWACLARNVAVLLGALLLPELTGCGSDDRGPVPTAEQRQWAAATDAYVPSKPRPLKEIIATYHTMKQVPDWHLAYDAGKEIIEGYPGAPEAVAVQKEIADGPDG